MKIGNVSVLRLARPGSAPRYSAEYFFVHLETENLVIVELELTVGADR